MPDSEEVHLWYILENDLPKAVDMETWSKWIRSKPRRVLKESKVDGTDIRVITVFFPLCYMEPQPDGSFKKYFYGTCIFGGALDRHEDMAISREVAEEDHERLFKLATEVHQGKTEIPDCCKK